MSLLELYFSVICQGRHGETMHCTVMGGRTRQHRNRRAVIFLGS